MHRGRQLCKLIWGLVYIRKAKNMPNTIKKTMEHWYEETGWVGMVMMGGIGINGDIEGHV